MENERFKDMISIFDSNVLVPCRTTVSREIINMKSSYALKLAEKIKDIPGSVSITTDAWSSRAFRGYLSVTMHWVDKSWVLRNVIIDFIRFPTTLNGQTTCKMLIEVLSKWNLTSKLRAVSTDNSADMICAMEHLSIQLNAQNGIVKHIEDIHVRCIAHVVNLAVKNCLG